MSGKATRVEAGLGPENRRAQAGVLGKEPGSGRPPDLAQLRDDTRKYEVIAARLQYLFTERQRDLLTDYMDAGMILDRLFDGDAVGRATAQQRMRIMIASKISLTAHTSARGEIDVPVNGLCEDMVGVTWKKFVV